VSSLEQAIACPEPVRSLTVVLTAQCNLRCAYCYQNARSTRRMGWGTLRRVLDMMLGSRRAEIELLFYGGEPLLELASMRQAVHYVESRSPPHRHISYATVTNGTLLGDEAVEFFARHRFDLQLSFDGVAAAQDLRSPGSFEHLDRTLDRLKRRHPDYSSEHLTVSLTLTPANLAYLADSVSYFLSKGVSEIAIAADIVDHPGWRIEGVDELDAQLSSTYDASLRYLFRTNRTPLQLFRKSGRGSKENKAPPGDGGGAGVGRQEPSNMCSIGSGAGLVIDTDGQVCGCPLLVTSYQKTSGSLAPRLNDLGMGDFRSADFPRRYEAFSAAARSAEIFHHRERKHSSYGRCGDCRFLTTCSVCPVSITTIPGNTDPHRVPDFACAFHRTASKYRERFP